jgi:hypothetical protein
MSPKLSLPLVLCGLLPAAGCGGGGGSSSSDGTTSTDPYTGTCGVGTAAYALAAGNNTLTSPSFTITGEADRSAFCAMNSGTSITLIAPTIISSASSSSSTNSSLYGMSAAVLAYGSSSTSTSGGAITVSGGTITTSSDYANGVFASGKGSSITASSVAITTSGSYAHAAEVAHTGTATVTGATLTSTAAEVVVLEGASTMTIVGSDLTSTNTTDSRGVYIYANPAGSGASTLTITNGTYLWSSASSSASAFYVYNQTTTINLTNVTLTNSTARLLTAAGPVGSNVTVNAVNQDLTGTVVIEAGSTVAVALDASSTWTLTGDSYVNELKVADCSKITYGGHTLFYKTFASSSAICSSPNLQLY